MSFQSRFQRFHDGDFDIDVGVVFDGLSHRKHDPLTVKGWVCEAVQAPSRTIEWRRACITVFYQQDGERPYHVDLAVFARDTAGNLRLAIGKRHSVDRHVRWQLDGRRRFQQLFEEKYGDKEDAAQLRRVIRYLKRWKAIHFPVEGRAAPSGYALTVAAFQWYEPATTGWFCVERDDLAAMRGLVSAMLQGFGPSRLSLPSPVEPGDDVFGSMSNTRMKALRVHLNELLEQLETAKDRDDIAPLRAAFGEDFPTQ